MYRGGKLASHPQSIALYIACPPQTWADEIAVLLQEQPTLTFSLGSVGFEFFRNGPYLVTCCITLSGMEETKYFSEFSVYI